MKATVVLGAGFSKNSGIPLQSEIPAMLAASKEDHGLEQAVDIIIKDFMTSVFGYHGTFPALDDLFTSIDLSTNSGHHLGMKYPPLDLRAVRRFIVYRVFSILDRTYTYNAQVARLIDILINRYHELNFVILNWDTALEIYIRRLMPGISIEYCNGGVPWGNSEPAAGSRSVKIMKIHGSDNWLYCDNCRTLFNDMYGNIPLIQRAGFKISDINLINNTGCRVDEKDLLTSVKCPQCSNSLSSHIATFSYRKSFRANAFPDIWKKAEEALSSSERWIFIGYSLPEADYEFKHLLKISELKYRHLKWVPKIDVILLNDKMSMEKYEGFFGSSLRMKCNGGIGEYIRSVEQLE